MSVIDARTYAVVSLGSQLIVIVLISFFTTFRMIWRLIMLSRNTKAN
jgi:hypothetical protein